MGISAVASYIGGTLIDTVDLAPDVVERCFPNAAAWPGRTTLADLGERGLRRRAAALALPQAPAGREPRLPDPGWARFRADGEAHLFSPGIAKEMQILSGSLEAEGGLAATVDAALAALPDGARPRRRRACRAARRAPRSSRAASAVRAR